MNSGIVRPDIILRWLYINPLHVNFARAPVGGPFDPTGVPWGRVRGGQEAEGGKGWGRRRGRGLLGGGGKANGGIGNVVFMGIEDTDGGGGSLDHGKGRSRLHEASLARLPAVYGI